MHKELYKRINKIFVYFTHFNRSLRGRICTKSDRASNLFDLIYCHIYFGNRLRGVDSVGGQFCPDSLTTAVAIAKLWYTMTEQCTTIGKL